MADNSRCDQCRHWDLANAGPPRPRPYGYIEGFDEPPPHANQRWARCMAALEGWEDEFDPLIHTMAVWDGSTYHAELLTRDRHCCTQFVPRNPIKTEAKP